MTSVRCEPGSVIVDGVTLPADWLRDNCRCDACRIVQTDERRWRPWSSPEPAQPLSAEAVAGELVVTWADGHRSVFGPADWAAIDRAMRRGHRPVRHWRRGDAIERFDHDTVLDDPEARRNLYEAFCRDGAAVVTGSPTVPGSIIDTSRKLGIALVDSSLGFIFDVKLDPAGFNVAFTSEALAPHNDNAQYTQPPSGQILAMLVNEATGGESKLVDGWNVLAQLEALDPAAIDVLARVKVGFRQYSDAADGFSRSPLIVRDPDGGYTHLRFSNQLRQPLPFDHPDLAEWYRAYRLLGTIVCDPANAVTFRLNGGDSLLVNGYRVLHAREAFVPDGPRHLQDVFFNADDVTGALDRLAGDAPNTMWVSST